MIIRLWVKGLKIVRLIQHTLYFLCGKRVGDYPQPPEGAAEIGFFDKKRRVHVAAEYRDSFNDAVLYSSGKYTQLLPESISLYTCNDEILVQKKFNGFQKYLKFYSELICLHRLREVGGVPAVRYVDYRSCILFIEYLDGIIVSWKRRNPALKIGPGNIRQIENDFLETLNRIHAAKIVIQDLKGSNMMKLNDICCFLDFADSVYYRVAVPGLTKAMIRQDQLKVKNALEEYAFDKEK